jgi:hypothetical protein
LLDDAAVRSPIVGEATQVSYDEIYVWILWSKHVDDVCFSGHVHE